MWLQCGTTVLAAMQLPSSGVPLQTAASLPGLESPVGTGTLSNTAPDGGSNPTLASPRPSGFPPGKSSPTNWAAHVVPLRIPLDSPQWNFLGLLRKCSKAFLSHDSTVFFYHPPFCDVAHTVSCLLVGVKNIARMKQFVWKKIAFCSDMLYNTFLKYLSRKRREGFVFVLWDWAIFGCTHFLHCNFQVMKVQSIFFSVVFERYLESFTGTLLLQ